VLRALGVPNDLAGSSLRLSLGKRNTEEEVDFVVNRMADVIGKLRSAKK